MNIEQAKKDVDTAQANLEQLQADLIKKRAEYNAAEESHARHVAQNTGRQRYPRSLQVQRESLLRLKLEIEVLEKAEKIAEEELGNAQTKLHLADLYKNVVKAYQHAEKVYFEMASEVIAAVDELNKITLVVCTIANKFLQQANNPLEILRRLTNDPALAGLSLSKFFSGEIADETPGENGRLLDQLATRYAEIARRLPDVKTAQESLEALSDHLDDITREANSLVPRHLKYIPQAATAKPESQVQRGRVLPRHARGGPDIDPKNDPNSDYWFHRRRSLQKVKDATTVIGKAKT